MIASRTLRSPELLLLAGFAILLPVAGAQDLASGPAVPGGLPSEPRLAQHSQAFNLLDNGDFQEAYRGADPARRRLIPWWRVSGTPDVMVQGAEAWLRTPPGSSVSQPLAAYAPLVSELRILGRVRGVGRLAIVDGQGGLFERALGRPGEVTQFELTGLQAAAALGRELQPRLELTLRSATDEPAHWTDVQAWVQLPCPDEDVLRAAIVERLDHVFGSWLDRGRPAGSPFIQHVFDVVTGEPQRRADGQVFEFPGGMFPLFEFEGQALLWEERPLWRHSFERFLVAYLDHCLDETTQLPRRWYPATQVPDGDRYREIAADMEFLIDAAQGSLGELEPALRERCMWAARRMGAAVLERGILPDGAVVASYRASDGAINLGTNPLRRLDVPAQLARLAAIDKDASLARAARNALAAFEFTHHWPGSWHDVDPGFDDDFGHYGARAVTMVGAFPGDTGMAALVDDGWSHYREMWLDGLRLGGSVAADQVRCWELLLLRAGQEPTMGDSLRPALSAAMRAHFKSQQYRNGAFGDVTFQDFDPQADISVGDLSGVPSNLLLGLGLCYGVQDTLDPARMRAMAATLLLGCDEHYRRDFGYLLSPRETLHFNSAGGGLRLCPGLIAWLGKLNGSVR